MLQPRNSAQDQFFLAPVAHIRLGNTVIGPLDKNKKRFLKAMPPKLILTNFKQQRTVPSPYAPILVGPR